MEIWIVLSTHTLIDIDLESSSKSKIPFNLEKNIVWMNHRESESKKTSSILFNGTLSTTDNSYNNSNKNKRKRIKREKIFRNKILTTSRRYIHLFGIKFSNTIWPNTVLKQRQQQWRSHRQCQATKYNSCEWSTIISSSLTQSKSLLFLSVRACEWACVFSAFAFTVFASFLANVWIFVNSPTFGGAQSIPFKSTQCLGGIHMVAYAHTTHTHSHPLCRSHLLIIWILYQAK